jgi:dTDP-4-amino-4,6-dideoxygalactose transaminase
MKVPFVDLGRQNSQIANEILEGIEAVLKRGDFILGDQVSSFEKAFATRMGSRFAVGVNSGFDALFLTLKSLGISPGDEVVTVPNSYVATPAAIAAVGATPRFVDVGSDENINPDLVEQQITSKTRVILPVHLRGRPAQMDALVDIARRYNLFLVEDCAQAVDATYNEQQVGTFGIAGCFSLHPLKNLGACGDGGIVITNDEVLYQRLQSVRNHGLQDRDYSLNPCLSWGYNSRLDTTAASILNVKLKYLDQWTDRRRYIAETYIEKLAHLPLDLPHEKAGQKCVYHAFVVQTYLRNNLRGFLQEQGIETKVQYPTPLHLQPAAEKLGYQHGDFPVAEQQCDTILSLPIYPELTDEQIEYCIASICAFFN